MSTAPGHLTYRPDVDGLRAVAVLSVVAYHAFPGGLRGGFIGVDIFFVISGYLITTIIAAEVAQGRFSLGEFYRRRIRRIFPALLLVLFTVTVFGWWALLPDEYAQLGRHLMGAAGFVSNLVLWNESGYFDAVAETKLLLHLWSLAIEEQFYLGWPLVLLLVAARPGRWKALPMLIGLGSLTTCLLLTPRDPTAAFFAPYARLWELMAGAALAHPAMAWQQRSEAQRTALSLAGAVLIALSLWTITPQRAFPGAWALMPVAGAVLLIWAGPRTFINRHLLGSRPAVAIGLISYPLYLWHWPILSYAYIEEGAKPGSGIRIAAVALSFVLAIVTARWVERPLRRGWPGAPVLRLGAAALASIALLGAVLSRDGVAARLPQASQFQRFAPPTIDPRLADACRERYPELRGLKLCFASGEGAPEVAFVGDSHLLQYAATIQQAMGARPHVILIHFACLPFSSRTREEAPHCLDAVDTATAFLAAHGSIRHVVLAAHWGYLTSSGFEARRGSSWRLPLPLDDTRARRFIQAGEAFLAKTAMPGRGYTALLDVPYLDLNINKCIAARPVNLVSRAVEHCAVDRSLALSRMTPYEETLRTLASGSPELQLFDPKPLFCDARWCWAVRNGTPWYADGDHVNARGAHEVIRHLQQDQGSRIGMPDGRTPQTGGNVSGSTPHALEVPSPPTVVKTQNP